MLAEKRNVLKTLKSAILKSYYQNNNRTESVNREGLLDFTDLEDLAFDLQVDIETEEGEIETERNSFYADYQQSIDADYYAFRQSQM